MDKRTRNNWYACKGKSGPVFCSLAALANWHSTLVNRLRTLANWLVGTFLLRGRQPEENILRITTVLSPRFLYYLSLKEKRYLAMWMWWCEGKLKVKIAHFRLPSTSQKRACLSSLVKHIRIRYTFTSLPENRKHENRKMWKLKDVKILAAEISLINSVPVRIKFSRHCRRRVDRRIMKLRKC